MLRLSREREYIEVESNLADGGMMESNHRRRRRRLRAGCSSCREVEFAT